MENFSKPQIHLGEHSPEDPRLGRLFGRGVDERNPPRAVILGFPSDQGVRRGGGPVGASAAPQAIRNHLYRFTPDGQNPGFADLVAQTQDLGDLIISGDVDQDQELLGIILARILKQGAVAVILGGGHETSYGHFLGYAHAGKNVSILNWDAHAGVRDAKDGLATSESAFRQALLHASESCRRYTVAGLQPHNAASSHLDFISNRNGRYFWKRALTSQQIDEVYSGKSVGEGNLMVSLDLDAVDLAHAPGVASPSLDGLSAELWLQAAQKAGKCPRVTSCDLVELNPLLDPDRRTARLAALAVWRFLAGLAERY